MTTSEAGRDRVGRRPAAVTIVAGICYTEMVLSALLALILFIMAGVGARSYADPVAAFMAATIYGLFGMVCLLFAFAFGMSGYQLGEGSGRWRIAYVGLTLLLSLCSLALLTQGLGLTPALVVPTVGVVGVVLLFTGRSRTWFALH